MRISSPATARRRWGNGGARAEVRQPWRSAALLELAHALLEVVDQPQRGRVERALVVGDGLDVPAHQLAQHRLDGRADAAAEARAQAQRTVSGDRPEPLGLGASRVAIVARAQAPGAAPDRRTSSFSCSRRAATSTGSLDEIPLQDRRFFRSPRASEDCTGGRDTLPRCESDQPPHPRPGRGRRRRDLRPRALPRAGRGGNGEYVAFTPPAAPGAGEGRGDARPRVSDVPGGIPQRALRWLGAAVARTVQTPLHELDAVHYPLTLPCLSSTSQPR